MKTCFNKKEEEIISFSGCHLLELMPPTQGQQYPQKRWLVCTSNRKKGEESKYQCNEHLKRGNWLYNFLHCEFKVYTVLFYFIVSVCPYFQIPLFTAWITYIPSNSSIKQSIISNVNIVYPLSVEKVIS